MIAALSYIAVGNVGVPTCFKRDMTLHMYNIMLWELFNRISLLRLLLSKFRHTISQNSWHTVEVVAPCCFHYFLALNLIDILFFFNSAI
jgi:hypothetical protein